MAPLSLGTSAGLRDPSDVAVDTNGNLYIADFQNCQIVIVTPEGGTSRRGTINFPIAVAVDAGGNVYVGDTMGFSYGSGIIHKLAPDGTMTAACGVPGEGDPTGLAVDTAGNLYVAAPSGLYKSVRKVTRRAGSETFFKSGFSMHRCATASDLGYQTQRRTHGRIARV